MAKKEAQAKGLKQFSAEVRDDRADLEADGCYRTADENMARYFGDSKLYEMVGFKITKNPEDTSGTSTCSISTADHPYYGTPGHLHCVYDLRDSRDGLSAFSAKKRHRFKPRNLKR